MQYPLQTELVFKDDLSWGTKELKANRRSSKMMTCSCLSDVGDNAGGEPPVLRNGGPSLFLARASRGPPGRRSCAEKSAGRPGEAGAVPTFLSRERLLGRGGKRLCWELTVWSSAKQSAGCVTDVTAWDAHTWDDLAGLG